MKSYSEKNFKYFHNYSFTNISNLVLFIFNTKCARLINESGHFTPGCHNYD